MDPQPVKYLTLRWKVEAPILIAYVLLIAKMLMEAIKVT